MQQEKTVKTSIKDLIHEQRLIDRIEIHVRWMHVLVTHAYSFCKFMFLSEFLAHQNGLLNTFNIAAYINIEFFHRVLLTLAGVRPMANIQNVNTRNAVNLIQRYLAEYLQHSRFVCVHVDHVANATSYEAMRMVTAYENTVKANFGNILRRLINTVLDVENRKAQIREEMEFEPENLIRQRIRDEVTLPARQFKELVSFNNRDMIPANLLPFYDLLRPYITYPEGYNFDRGNLFYDAKTRPANHFKNYFLICRYYHNEDQRSYKCFPLRTSIIPCYTTIDATTLFHVILGWPSSATYNLGDLLALCYPGAPRAKRISGLVFQGTMLTDGVGVSLVNSPVNRVPAGIRGRYIPIEEEEFQSLGGLDRENLLALGTAVSFLDPGRQDLLYGIRYNSQPELGLRIKFRYTRSERAKITGMKAARNQRDNIPEVILDRFHVREALALLSDTTHSNLNLEDFVNYIVTRSHEFVQDLCNFFATYQTEEHRYPLHRKLRLSAYFGQVKEQYFLADSIRDRLDTNTLIIGNWSAPMARYHEPIKGIGLLRMLRRSGFDVFTIDEHLTSSFCPTCGHAVENFSFALRGRPYQRLDRPFARCHGLLRCTNDDCLAVNEGELEKKRLWNRDMLAVLNFRIIFDQLRHDMTIPERFRRRQNPLLA